MCLRILFYKCLCIEVHPDYVSIGKFIKSTSNEISIKKGDKLIFVEQNTLDPNWYRVRNLRTHKIGYVPFSLIARVDSIEAKDWFFTDIMRHDAELLLEHFTNKKGTFLIRKCVQFEDKFALSVLTERSNNERQSKHYLINVSVSDMFKTFSIDNKIVFRSLDNLITYYSESNKLGVRLKNPCPKAIEVPGVRGVWEENRRHIKLKRKIGQGVCGDVYKGVWRKKYPVAVKVIRESNPLFRLDMLNEAEKLKNLKHKHIVRLFCVCTRNPIYIVTELMSKGSLQDYLRKDQGKCVNFRVMINMSTQITSGLKYLHANRCVHCDIAARNILVNGGNIVKISDFGLSHELNQNNRLEIPADESAHIPLKWTAPEVLDVSNGMRIYTPKADVWSFGVLIYELVTYGQSPYPDIEKDQVIKKVREGYRMNKPAGVCTDEFYNIMLKCWNIDPESRPDFNSLFEIFDNYFITIEPKYGD